jgi:hypothetical protein
MQSLARSIIQWRWVRQYSLLTSQSSSGALRNQNATTRTTRRVCAVYWFFSASCVGFQCVTTHLISPLGWTDVILLVVEERLSRGGLTFFQSIPRVQDFSLPSKDKRKRKQKQKTRHKNPKKKGGGKKYARKRRRKSASVAVEDGFSGVEAALTILLPTEFRGGSQKKTAQTALLAGV